MQTASSVDSFVLLVWHACAHDDAERTSEEIFISITAVCHKTVHVHQQQQQQLQHEQQTNKQTSKPISL